ncbi:malate synthase A [Chitinophaga pendula]|uniref:malate synthase A n=1 Tax=Chitinophaga TaxID=79328 RepID=UPI000BAFE01B|nr:MULTISPECIES: malate synthase A [Chitinophaga]ASZ12263.1 malate synthase A [Chitinophaga sp. MD30]UCJ10151.1 malate synthase A [Chitinophaga pendula]
MITPIPTTSTRRRASIHAPARTAYPQVLTEEALVFLSELHHHFNATRLRLLSERAAVQARIEQGKWLDFDPATADIRVGYWEVSAPPADLQDRRVEITGPVDRKMMINALNSGANVFMADLEDSHTPSWDNVLQGQINLQDAVRRTISYTNEQGKQYVLGMQVATLMVRPRGWHLTERHLRIGAEAMSASLFDFGLYFFHNAEELLNRGSGPYFYLPKLESYLEARLWNEVFDFAERYLQLPEGCTKATVLIETIPAVFQMHEILWELRTRSVGLNCGRWDYIFSFIKKHKDIPGYLFPDRSQITMTVPCMRAYTQLVVKTCHRRGIHAIGGMAAQIPIRDDERANALAMERVRADKLREVIDGHDGTWVAHPGLVPVAKAIFDEHMPTPHQLHEKRSDFHTTAEALLALPEGSITVRGVRLNIQVGILYLESWLRGNGAVAIHYLMEDAATAEISRIQVWQWLRAQVRLDDGRTLTYGYYQELLADEVGKIRVLVGSAAYAGGQFDAAIRLFEQLVTAAVCEDFLTIPAYTLID